ncbi:MAG: PAS domain-containing protein [Bacteroidetes bacterium]|nr:MAG: PAS domain-containing protein [Bacteroidota bacterium]
MKTKTEIVDIEEIQEVIVSYANGDYDRRLSISEEQIERDIIVSGINMLGEELQKRTVSRDFFLGIFNSIPEVLLVLDDEGRVTGVNETGVQLIEFNQGGRVIGKKLTEVFAEQLDKQFDSFRELEQNSVSFEMDLKINDILTFPALCSFSRIGNPGSEPYLFIAQDISEKKREELRILKATISGQESERRRLANDLHDSLGQELNAVKMYVSAIEKMDCQSELYKKSMQEVHGLLEMTIDSIREISFGLMPSVLQKESLNVSVLQLVNRMNAIQEIRIFTDISEDPVELVDKNDELFLYRIIQEFLNNSLKYSKASEIWVKLKEIKLQNHKILNVVLTDDGVGFNFDQVRSNNGLNNIIYRLKALGAEYRFESRKGVGTNLNINLINFL